MDSTGRELYTCGQLGIRVCLPCRIPLVTDKPTISQVSCGENHVLALTCDGTVYSWGDNNCGQCGHSGPEDVPRPKMIKTLGAFLSGAFQHVSGGVLHSVAIVNRNYYYDILTDFYKEHDETKIPNVPMMLRKYQVR